MIRQAVTGIFANHSKSVSYVIVMRTDKHPNLRWRDHDVKIADLPDYGVQPRSQQVPVLRLSSVILLHN